MDQIGRKRAGVNEVIPSVLYQRGQFVTWPHDYKRRMLDDLNISVVVNLWLPVDSDLARVQHESLIYIAWHIPGDSIPVTADRMITFIAGLMRDGRRVLVHCEAGRNRSAWLCARLAANVVGLSRPEAWDLIKRTIPSAKVNRAFELDLQK